MDYRKEFRVKPGTKIRLHKIDPAYKGKHISEDKARSEIEKYRAKLAEQQYLLYSERRHSLLIVLQAMDAAGKDGTVNHVMSAMNPQGTTVIGFKGPTALELEHDFLWRVHPHAPAKGTVAIFNRSHYEDVLVVRVHKLAPKEVWSGRYQLINDFEKLLRTQNNTQIIKFFLHISNRSNWRASSNDSMILQETGKSATVTTRSVNFRLITLRLSKTCSNKPAPSTLPGTSFLPITNGFATWLSRKSWPRPWKIWG